MTEKKAAPKTEQYDSRTTRDIWTAKARKLLVGRTIAAVRYMTEEEAEDSGFYSSPIVIIFDDGSYIFPMRDDEGNDAGALATSDEENPTLPVI
tara:strand:- start:1651 stop:1932 length:282 start_codon:yes stop_codon:yes gene_type:complete